MANDPKAPERIWIVPIYFEGCDEVFTWSQAAKDGDGQLFIRADLASPLPPPGSEGAAETRLAGVLSRFLDWHGHDLRHVVIEQLAREDGIEDLRSCGEMSINGGPFVDSAEHYRTAAEELLRRAALAPASGEARPHKESGDATRT